MPSRHGIFSYVEARANNHKIGMRDWLDPKVPTIARTFRDAGYATGHFGKWHMGGGRDVGDAPLITDYGFDESLTSFEGLGDRVLPPGKLSEQSEKLGRGKIAHAPKHKLTEIFVNRSLDFISRHRDKPFYVNLWPDDVHDPFQPDPESLKKYADKTPNKYQAQFWAVLEEFDRQIGRFVDRIDQMGLAKNTVIVFLGDNGPTAWPYYYKEHLDPPGLTAGLRGRKWSLYEGGIRESFFIRWKGKTPARHINERTIISSLDLFPSLCKIAGVEAPAVAFDGEDVTASFFGKDIKRKKDLFWEYGRDKTFLRPGLPQDQSPNLAVRSGDWKLLMNADGSQQELYNLAKAPREDQNVAQHNPAVEEKLRGRLLDWRKSLP